MAIVLASQFEHERGARKRAPQEVPQNRPSMLQTTLLMLSEFGRSHQKSLEYLGWDKKHPQPADIRGCVDFLKAFIAEGHQFNPAARTEDGETELMTITQVTCGSDEGVLLFLKHGGVPNPSCTRKFTTQKEYNEEELIDNAQSVVALRAYRKAVRKLAKSGPVADGPVIVGG